MATSTANRFDRHRNVHGQVATTRAQEDWNRKTDPRETTDLANAQPDMVQRMQALMKEAHVDNPNYRLTPKTKKDRKQSSDED